MATRWLALPAGAVLLSYLMAADRKPPAAVDAAAQSAVVSAEELPELAHSGSAVTQALFRLIPLRVQHALRDSGAMGVLMDLITCLGGALLFATKPRALCQFARGPAHTSVRYGPSAWRHSVDVFNAHRRRDPTRAAAAASVGTESAPLTPSPSAAATASAPPKAALGSAAVAVAIGSKQPLSPVVMFIHGGAWGSGYKLMYRLLGRRFDCEGYVTFVPGYRVYPQANVHEQIEDVAAALRWTALHAARYGGDASRLYVCGHSSGAHVLSLLLLRAARGSLPSGGIPAVSGFIGLAGPYDMSAHYEYERGRGVHEISPLKPANGGGTAAFAEESAAADAPKGGGAVSGSPAAAVRDALFAPYSATHVAATLTSQQAQRLPPCLLLHGVLDDVVPATSTTRLAGALRGVGVDVAAVLLRDFDHASIVMDAMLKRRFADPTNDNLLHTISTFIRSGAKGVRAMPAPSPSTRSAVLLPSAL